MLFGKNKGKFGQKSFVSQKVCTYVFVLQNSWLCNEDFLHFGALRVINDAQKCQEERLRHHCQPVVDR